MSNLKSNRCFLALARCAQRWVRARRWERTIRRQALRGASSTRVRAAIRANRCGRQLRSRHPEIYQRDSVFDPTLLVTNPYEDTLARYGGGHCRR